MKTILILACLLLASPAYAGPPNPAIAPGSYFNPYVFTPDNRGGGTIQSEIYTGGNPLAPGNFANPLVIERDGRNLKIRPTLPYPMGRSYDQEGD